MTKANRVYRDERIERHHVALLASASEAGAIRLIEDEIERIKRVREGRKA